MFKWFHDFYSDSNTDIYFLTVNTQQKTFRSTEVFEFWFHKVDQM